MSDDMLAALEEGAAQATQQANGGAAGPRRRKDSFTRISRVPVKLSPVTDQSSGSAGTIDKNIDANMILSNCFKNELNGVTMRFFAAEFLTTNKEIIISPPDAPEISVRARVVWCHKLVRRGNIISEKTFEYRTEVMLIQSDYQTIDQVMKFVKEINAKYVPEFKAA